ncbi:FtsK/SpoIIIE domain-containing protein [Aliarcobacter cryaerophilus]
MTSAASGSGKSVLLNLKLLSHLKNINLIDRLILCDFKGGVELNRYSNLNEKITFIDTMEDFIAMLEDLVKTMNERYQYLKSNSELKYHNDFIFLIIDEFGTIASFPKKEREHIFILLTLILQKGRACNLLTDFYLQKFDAQSVPTQISVNFTSTTLMRSQSDYANSQLIGVQEEIKKINNLEPIDFPIGRMIHKNGLTSEYSLVQVPYFQQDTYLNFI